MGPTGSERIIRKDTFAHCPFSAAIERAHLFLRSAEERGRIEQLVVPANLAITVVDDFTDSVRRHDALEFRWRPRSPLFPVGRALLTVRPHAPHGAELQFSIAYVPPFGVAGRIFDSLIGRYIAAITASLLVNRLRAEVERA